MKCVTCGTAFDAECDGAPLRPFCSCAVTSYRSVVFLDSDASSWADQIAVAAEGYEEHLRPSFLQRVADELYELIADKEPA